jgi:hypothetical protein
MAAGEDGAGIGTPASIEELFDTLAATVRSDDPAVVRVLKMAQSIADIDEPPKKATGAKGQVWLARLVVGMDRVQALSAQQVFDDQAVDATVAGTN